MKTKKIGIGRNFRRLLTVSTLWLSRNLLASGYISSEKALIERNIYIPFRAYFTKAGKEKINTCTSLRAAAKVSRHPIIFLTKLLFMPTRLKSELVKVGCRDLFVDYMHKMTKGSLISAAELLILWMFLDLYFGMNTLLLLLHHDNIALSTLIAIVSLIVLLYTFSRISEITWAFFNDAYTHLLGDEDYIKAKGTKKSDLTYAQRVHLATFSYGELVLDFAILFYISYALFYALFCVELFNVPLTALEALYFSGVTITTLGYGDISPSFFLTKLLSIGEVFTGFTLIIVAFTIYVSRALMKLEQDEARAKRC